MKHTVPKFLVNGVPYDDYRRDHSLSPEEKEKNKLWLLKEFAPAFYEFEVLEEKWTWTN